jgi:hypothetical protein
MLIHVIERLVHPHLRELPEPAVVRSHVERSHVTVNRDEFTNVAAADSTGG